MVAKTTAKPAAKTAKPAAKKAATAKKTPSEAAREFFRPNYESMMKVVDQKFGGSTGNMSVKARKESTISTGLLSTNLIMGGGLIAGTWNTFLGGEGSAKSTHLAHIKIAAADSGVPVLKDYDFEGSQSPVYYEGIMEYYSRLKNVTELYGLQDDKGNWVLPPKVKYENVSVAEDFFNPASALLRRMPDKLYLENRWWYAWDADKHGKAMAGTKYSKAMFSKYRRLMIEAEDGLPQAIFFLDSYPAMYPGRLDEDEAGSGMAAVARAMSENVPKILSKLRVKGLIVCGVNQLRLRPGFNMGDPSYEPAGETIKFASSARWRQTARVPPHKGPGVAKGVEWELSEIYENAKDVYRYIHVKNIKNKTSTPYLESWQRVWVDDGTGTAHGFDPVYDTIGYLKATGQLACPERFNGATPMKLTMEGQAPLKLSYSDFKALILLKGKDVAPICQGLGLTKNPFIRERCFKQLEAGRGQELYFEHVVAKTAGTAAKVKDEEVEEDDDEIEIDE
jgi:RecA/RadA recombinase